MVAATRKFLNRQNLDETASQCVDFLISRLKQTDLNSIVRDRSAVLASSLAALNLNMVASTASGLAIDALS